MDADELVRAIRAALDAQVRHVEWVRDWIPENHQGEFIDPAAVLRRVTADREIVDAYEEQLRRQEDNSRDFAVELAAPSYSFDPARLSRLKEAGWQIAGRVDGLCAAVRALARGLGINPEEETP